jgi:hypothetical protein
VGTIRAKRAAVAAAHDPHDRTGDRGCAGPDERVMPLVAVLGDSQEEGHRGHDYQSACNDFNEHGEAPRRFCKRSALVDAAAFLADEVEAANDPSLVVRALPGEAGFFEISRLARMPKRHQFAIIELDG